MSMDESAIQAVADELEIRKLVARYADAVSHPNVDAWVDTWAADGRWLIGGQTAEGHDSLRTTWLTLMGFFERVVQLPQDGLLELAGDAGTGRWSMIEIGRNVNGDPVFTIGQYDDVYRRTAEGWKFAERSFGFSYTGPPDLTGPWIP